MDGKPALEYHIQLSKKYGITDIIMCGSYLVDKIKNYFGSGEKFGVKIVYPEEFNPLGTGGAIRNAKNFLLSADNFIVLNGDVLTNINLQDLIDFHISKNSLATVVLRNTYHPIDSDIVQIDENSRVVKYIGRGQEEEKIANTGIMVLNKLILNLIPDGVSNIEKDVIFKLIDKYKIYGYLSKDYIKDMGTFERLEKIRKDFPKVFTVLEK